MTSTPNTTSTSRAGLGRSLMLLGFACLILSALLARAGRGLVDGWFFIFAAWSGLLIIDGWVHRQRGESLLLTHPRRFLFLAAWSVPFWLLHELLNFRLNSWHHLSLSPDTPLRWVGYVAAFAVIVPGILETADLLDSVKFLRSVSVSPLPRGRREWFMGAGASFLTLALAWPNVFAPLVWVVPLLLFDPGNEKAGEPSFLAEWRVGRVRRFVVLLAAGFLCGVLWRAWALITGAPWEREVVDFEKWKSLRAPALGRLGILPFAAGAYAAAVWASFRWERAGPRLRTALVLLALSGTAVMFIGIDRFTLLRP